LFSRHKDKIDKVTEKLIRKKPEIKKIKKKDCDTKEQKKRENRG
jgi:hypothetical protein